MTERPEIKILVLPGGSLPERMTEGAIGYDVRIRAIVSPTEMDREYPNLRKTLFDFINWPTDPFIAHHIMPKTIGGNETELIYRMEPGESVLAGIGFVTQMSFPLFYWVAPRSGLASKYGINVTNAPGTVDPDYRGEAGVLIYNRNHHSFDLSRNMRIAQIIFQKAIIPEFEKVHNTSDFTDTPRGSGGFGSTGIV